MSTSEPDTWSQVATALSSVSLENDSDVEIIGPVKDFVRKPRGKPTHPFFLNPSNTSSAKKSVKARCDKRRESISTASDTRACTLSLDANELQAEDRSLHLPLYSYLDYDSAPALVLTRHEEEANDLIQSLSGPLGFDMEWPVFFCSGLKERRTALVQLCDERMILLMQTSAMKKFPHKLREVLESSTIEKIGASVLNDARKLYRDFGIQCAGLVELGAFARHTDGDFAGRFERTLGKPPQSNRTIISLARLVAMYEHRTLAKGAVRTANWEEQLSGEMKLYAANDVHSSLMVYRSILATTAQRGGGLHSIPDVQQCNTPFTLMSLTENEGASAPVPAVNAPFLSPASTLPRPQHLRAYRLWHHRRMPLHGICAALRSAENPLKEGTVITYVISALRADASLPFCMARLRELVQMEASSWSRHREAIAALRREQRGML